MAAFDTARRVLLAVEGLLNAAGRPLPDRRMVQAGSTPAWDDEQITVTVVRPSVPGGVTSERTRPHPVPGPRWVELRVEVVRCVPTGDTAPPTVAQIETTAAGLLLDAEALGALTPLVLTGRAGQPALIGPVEMLGPDGGLAAATCLVSVPA